MITLDELRQAVAFVIDRAEADHGPDFRYHADEGRCEYRPTLRNPYGCVVGAALTELGWPVPADLNDKGIREVVNAGAVNMARDAEEWAAVLQSWQDMGTTWRDAVKAADSIL